MDEREFWDALEYRVCDEIAGFADHRLRGLWCDGFVPDLYLFEGPRPRVEGRAWLAKGGTRLEWRYAFTLLLGPDVREPEEIDWSALLPPDDMTRWLTIDPDRKALVIEPGAAVPDARPSRG